MEMQGRNNTLFDKGYAMMEAKQVRLLIAKILLQRRTLMTTAQISEALIFTYGLRLSNLSIGSNLGYLRAAGTADRRQAPMWGKPYWLRGKWNYQSENWWWHTDAVAKADAMIFVRKIRQDVEMKTRDNQRIRGRAVTNRLPPRTDDMRQMVDDMGRV